MLRLCWMRKRVEKSSTILALLDGYHELHLDRSAWVITVLHLIFFFWFHVYEVEHCLCRRLFTQINFVRFETMISPRIEFTKSWEIFWPRLERSRSEQYLVHEYCMQENSKYRVYQIHTYIVILIYWLIPTGLFRVNVTVTVLNTES